MSDVQLFEIQSVRKITYSPVSGASSDSADFSLLQSPVRYATESVHCKFTPDAQPRRGRFHFLSLAPSSADPQHLNAQRASRRALRTAMAAKRKVKSEPELVTLAAVSRELGVAPATIANAPQDFFPHHRLCGRRYVFGKDLKAWLARRATASTTATA